MPAGRVDSSVCLISVPQKENQTQKKHLRKYIFKHFHTTYLLTTPAPKQKPTPSTSPTSSPNPPQPPSTSSTSAQAPAVFPSCYYTLSSPRPPFQDPSPSRASTFRRRPSALPGRISPTTSAWVCSRAGISLPQGDRTQLPTR